MEARTAMVRRRRQPADWKSLLGGLPAGNGPLEYRKNRNIFRQGDPADCVFYLRRGRVHLGVTSGQGKEAIVAAVSGGEFFGEGCLAGQPLRMATATATCVCILFKIEKPLMARLLHEHHEASEMFVAYLLSRSIRFEEDLLDQMFNSSERRLARILLLLARYGSEPRSEIIVPRINQERLAQMVGITRSRVSHFMSKFKKLGFIDYKGPELTINNGLLGLVLNG